MLDKSTEANAYDAFRQSSCTRKERHQSKSDALVAASLFLKQCESDSDFFRPYSCHFCHGWHLTTKPWNPKPYASDFPQPTMKTPLNEFEEARKLVRSYEETIIELWGARRITEKSSLMALIDEAETNAELHRWRPVERFPQTKDELRAWYCPPTNREEADAEQAIDFPGYPLLGEIHEETMPFGHVMQVAASDIVETRCRDGSVVSARWVWHKYAMGAYRWEVAPQRWAIEPRNVDFWRPMDSI